MDSFHRRSTSSKSRVVLSRTTQGLSVVVSGLSPRLRVLNREQQAFTAEINQAFSSFQSDYDQARATYFASISESDKPERGDDQRVHALHEPACISARAAVDQHLHPVAAGHREGTGSAVRDQVACQNKIIGPQGETPKGSLAKSLLETIPQPGTSAPTSSLYTLSQDNAIQTAQDAVFNGLSIIKNGAFGIQKVSQY